MTDKQLAWDAYKEAWNQASSMDSLTKLEERTARQQFETWWNRNHSEGTPTFEGQMVFQGDFDGDEHE